MSSQTSIDEWEWRPLGRDTDPAEREDGNDSVLDRAGEGAAYRGSERNRGKPAGGGVSAGECGYCGSHVSAEYVRVCGVGGEVDVCPNCRADQDTTTGGRRL